MNIPELIGLEVNTPDGRGHILSLHSKRVMVLLNTILPGQQMKGHRSGEMHFSYPYEEVEIIKGRQNFIQQ